MQFFYDGQIRRYLGQTIRALSQFTVKYADGTLVRVPVMYGDADKQSASIMRQNSENKINSTPRIAVYITSLSLDRTRLADATHIGKVHIREREFDDVNQEYTQAQGKNYTVERLMPTPFILKMKADIWTSSTEQKLQVLEQILVLFNPSLELQTSDNYIDWASLTVLDLTNITWSSRSVPVGTSDSIDLATLELETPIWLSPPVKVKHLGVITSIITSVFGSADTSWTNIDGLGADITGGSSSFSDLLTRDKITINNFGIQVYGGQAILLNNHESVTATTKKVDIPVRLGAPVNWSELLAQTGGQFVNGSSKIYLVQPGGAEVSGTVAINPLDDQSLTVNWDPATYSPNTDIQTTGDREAGGGRSVGTFDAIIDPTKVYPGHGMTNVVAGDRFLIVEDIASTGIHQYGTAAWGTFTAKENDIIEWDGSSWHVIFEAAQEADRLVWQTNIYSGVQYMWNNVSWVKSFEGEYRAGEWRLEL